MACISSLTTSRIKANKQGNRPSKACDRARSHESKPKQACQSTSESQILPTTIVRLIPFRHNLPLLYPTGRYQQSIGTFTDYVSVGDKWFITSPYLQSLDMLRNWSASRLQSLIGKPTDRSLCHAFVALSDPMDINTPVGTVYGRQRVTLSDRQISTKHWNVYRLRFSGRQMVHHIAISPKP
jgi:hypothetical protein